MALNVEVIKTMLMEDSNPMLTEAQLEMLAATYDNINEACYYGCLMKASSENITIGPDGFYRRFIREQNGEGLTGLARRRSDEL